MSIFTRVIDNSGDEHHETPCPRRDDGGLPWIRRDYTGRNNPMGWGRNDPRPVRETRPRMHGSRAERNLMSGTGGLIRWSGKRVAVTGEKPEGRKR